MIDEHLFGGILKGQGLWFDNYSRNGYFSWKYQPEWLVHLVDQCVCNIRVIVNASSNTQIVSEKLIILHRQTKHNQFSQKLIFWVQNLLE